MADIPSDIQGLGDMGYERGGGIDDGNVIVLLDSRSAIP